MEMSEVPELGKLVSVGKEQDMAEDLRYTKAGPQGDFDRAAVAGLISAVNKFLSLLPDAPVIAALEFKGARTSPKYKELPADLVRGLALINEMITDYNAVGNEQIPLLALQGAKTSADLSMMLAAVDKLTRTQTLLDWLASEAPMEESGGEEMEQGEMETEEPVMDLTILKKMGGRA